MAGQKLEALKNDVKISLHIMHRAADGPLHHDVIDVDPPYKEFRSVWTDDKTASIDR